MPLPCFHSKHSWLDRLVKHAVEADKPVLLLNIGPTRADGLVGVEKIEFSSGEVLRGAARALT